MSHLLIPLFHISIHVICDLYTSTTYLYGMSSVLQQLNGDLMTARALTKMENLPRTFHHKLLRATVYYMDERGTHGRKFFEWRKCERRENVASTLASKIISLYFLPSLLREHWQNRFSVKKIHHFLYSLSRTNLCRLVAERKPQY